MSDERMSPEVARIVTDALEDGRLITAQEHRKCQMCGETAELRPYGPNGERVCFPCAMKDEEAARRAFARRIAPVTERDA